MKRDPTLQNMRPRTGATAVEFALVAPILFTFIFAAIEFSRANMLAHTCEIAALEGARKGMVPGSTSQSCRDTALAELSRVRIAGGVVEVSPSTLSMTTPEVNVTVRAPMTIQNGYVFPRFFLGREITRSITLQREAISTGS